MTTRPKADAPATGERTALEPTISSSDDMSKMMVLTPRSPKISL